MLHKEFWGLMFLFFVGWIFLGSTGGERIERGCRPIGWAGNVITSLSALAVPTQQTRIAGWFGKFEYGCQYVGWRMFFEHDYQVYMDKRSQSALGVGGDSPAERAAADKARQDRAVEGATSGMGKPGPQGAL
jgi:hypothetical protein